MKVKHQQVKSIILLLSSLLFLLFTCATANAALTVNWIRNVSAEGNTWFNESTAGINRSDVTQINFATTAPSSYTKSWNADAGGTGAAICYLNGTTVTIVGDANGVYAHKDSADTFFSGFTKATTITGLNLLHLDNVENQAVALPNIVVTNHEFLGWSTTSLEWTPERTDSDAEISASTNTYSGTQTELFAVLKLLNKCEVMVGPADAEITYGETTTMYIVAEGGAGATMTYQWQESTDGGTSWSDIFGATSENYTTEARKSAGTYKVRCVANSTLDTDVKTDTSSAATLTINKIGVYLQWSDYSWVYDGTAHSLSCTVPSDLLLSGDTCTVTLSGNSLTNVGSTIVKAIGFSNNNYGYTGMVGDDGYPYCDLYVCPKQAVLNWGTTSWTYDGTEHSTTCTVSNLCGSDTCTVTLVNNSITDVGDREVTATALSNSNYELPGPSDRMKTLTITQREAVLSWGTTSWVYDGSTHSTTCTVSNLCGSDTCTVELSGNVIQDAGSTTVEAWYLSNSNYKLPSTATKTLTITQKEATLSWGETSWTYDGTVHSTTCTVSNLCGSDDCTVELDGNIIQDAGSTTVTATALTNSNYKLPSTGLTKTLTVNAYNLSGATIEDIDSVTYTGSAFKPTPAVTSYDILFGMEEDTIVADRDFTYSYSNNTNAGTATVTITGKGNYTGTNTKSFTINKANSTITFVPSVGATVTATTGESGVFTNIALQKGTSAIAIGTIGDNGAGTVSVSNIANNTGDKISVSTVSGSVKVTPSKQTSDGSGNPSPVALTVSVPEGANYLAASMTINVYVTEKPVVSVSYNTTSYTSSDVVMTVNAKAFLADITVLPTAEEITDVYLMIGTEKTSFFSSKVGMEYTYTFTGNTTCTLYVTDNYGGVYSKSITVDWIDKTPPTVPTISAKQGEISRSSGDWSTGNVTITISGGSAYSNIAGYKYQLDGGVWTAGSTFTISTNGTHTVKAKAVSGSALESEETSAFTVKLDKDAPTLTINGNPTAWAYDATLTLVPADTGTSEISKVYFKNSGSEEVTMVSPYTKEIIANGTYTFGVIDVAGNRTEKSVTVTLIDHAAPTIPTISAKQDKTVRASGDWSTGDVTVTISGGTAASGIANYKYQLDDGAWATGGSFTISTEGTHTIKAKAVSTVAQESAETSAFTVKLDKTAPTLTINGNPTAWAYDATLTLAPADTGTSGIAKVYFKNSGSEEVTMVSPYTKEITANGTYTFGVIDVAGNRTEKSVTVTLIDHAAPTIPTITAEQNTINRASGDWSNGDVTVTVSGGTAASGIASYKYQLDGGVWTAGSSFTISAEGTHTIKAKAVSTVAQESAETSAFTVKLDKTAPTLTINGNPTAWAYDATLTLVPADTGTSGIAKVYYKNDEVENTLTSPYEKEIVSNGTYTFGVIDVAGNRVEESVTVTLIDHAVPSEPTISAKQGAINKSSGDWSNGNVTITISGGSAASGIASYKYSLDGGTWTDGASFSISDEGIHTVKAKSVSTVAQESAASSTFTVKVDKTMPSYSLVKSPVTYTKDNVELTITGEDTLSGFKEMRFNDSAWSEETENTYTAFNNGTFTLQVSDIAGNVKSFSITVDNIDREVPTTPTIKVMKGATSISSGEWTNGSLDISISAVAAASNISGIASYKYSLDGVDWTAGSQLTLTDAGYYNIYAKSVSGTGIESLPASFTVGIDKTAPTMTLTGNPTEWCQEANIQVTPADLGDSGVVAVYTYDGADKIELLSPYVRNVTDNGTYTFEVHDAAGNIGSSTVTVTKVDSKAPSISAGYPREVELAVNQTSAVIHLISADIGDSGLAYITYPDESVSAVSEVNLEVTENGDYTFKATDRSGNVTTKTVHVSGIIMSDDNALNVIVYAGEQIEAHDLTNGEPLNVNVDINGVPSVDLVVTSTGAGAKIKTFDSVAVNSNTYTKTFAIAQDETMVYSIEVVAANGDTETYEVTITSVNDVPSVVSIVNKAMIEKSRYTEEGYVLSRQFTSYSTGKEGVEIQITAKDGNNGQYVKGYVAYDGINYDINWDKLASGVTEYKTDGKERKGYVLIPVSAFYDEDDPADRSNTYAYIYLSDALTAGGEVLSSSDTSSSVKIQTDVTAPVVNTKLYSTKYALQIGVADTTVVSDIEVTLTPSNGVNAGVDQVTHYTQKELSQAITLEDAINYAVKIVATDIAGHVTTVNKLVNSSGTITDSGSGSGSGSGDEPGGDTPEEDPELSLYTPIEVNFSATEGGVYGYKTRTATYCIVGSTNSNTSSVSHRSIFTRFKSDFATGD